MKRSCLAEPSAYFPGTAGFWLGPVGIPRLLQNEAFQGKLKQFLRVAPLKSKARVHSPLMGYTAIP